MNRLSDKVTIITGAASGNVANLVLFLASEESRYITGTEIIIDGGWTAQQQL